MFIFSTYEFCICFQNASFFLQVWTFCIWYQPHSLLFGTNFQTTGRTWILISLMISVASSEFLYQICYIFNPRSVPVEKSRLCDIYCDMWNIPPKFPWLLFVLLTMSHCIFLNSYLVAYFENIICIVYCMIFHLIFLLPPSPFLQH